MLGVNVKNRSRNFLGYFELDGNKQPVDTEKFNELMEMVRNSNKIRKIFHPKTRKRYVLKRRYRANPKTETHCVDIEAHKAEATYMSVYVVERSY